MSTEPSLIGIVKKHLENGQIPVDRDQYKAIAQALILAVDTLEKIRDNDMPTDLDEEPQIMASDALFAIRSLNP